MADVDDDRSVATSDGSGGLNMDEDAGIDVDFGAIEMFDSNAAPTMFSSGAPEAIMTEDAALPPSSKKAKRDKKDRNNKKDKKDKKREKSEQGLNSSSSVPEEEEQKASRQHKLKGESTRDVEVPDSQPSNEQVETAADIPWGQPQEEEEDDEEEEEETRAVAFQKAKHKHKLSHSADGKKRKKHRARSQELGDEAEKGGHRASEEAGVTSFLRVNKDGQGATESAIYGDNDSESDTQASPTIAHLRRRSQSREARSRENSVPPSVRMKVDVANTGAVGQIATDAAVDSDCEAERIAREAWNEHRNGPQSQDENTHGDDDTEMGGQYPQEPLSTGAADMTAEAQLTSPQRKKPRKKAKPTFFERPGPEILADEDNENGLAELPSPSAMTPNPRNRKKRAAKKESRGRKPKREKSSQSMRGGSVDGEEGERAIAERRNRLTGYTQGRFSDAELARISRAVESFRGDNGLTQAEVNELIHAPGGTTAGETNAQLWTRIFAECPDRHRQKVINITRKKFHNFVARGTWTPQQDAELAELINMHGTKWSLIASIINRHPEDLRDRYRNYIVCGANQRKDAWDEHEEARLTQYIMESMRAIDELRASEPNRAILQKSYEELIDWQDISERMDRTRSRLQCITKWKSLNIRTHGRDKLVSTQPDSQISFRLEKARRQIAVMPTEERYRLVMAIQATAAGTEVRIPWQRLVDKPFRNQWHRYTQMLLWRRLKATVPNPTEASVRDTALYLIDHYNQTGDLPGVPDELFDDADEMNFIQTITPPPPVGGTQANGHGQLSMEFVTASDVENDEADRNGGTEAGGGEDEQDQPPQPEPEPEPEPQPEPAADEELKIDPALAEAGPMTSKKSTPTKRGSKTPGSRGRDRKALADVDPIEDATQEPAPEPEPQPQPQPQPAQGSDSEVHVERLLGKKKTSRQFQTSQAPQLQGDEVDQQLLPDDDDDSVMDDMEDLPATIGW
ncbi:hypothetical protein E4U41_005537 [Claviceps citrina]|nr:hypothetical protein E4U41_005537 [Claviceps citrina]